MDKHGRVYSECRIQSPESLKPVPFAQTPGSSDTADQSRDSCGREKTLVGMESAGYGNNPKTFLMEPPSSKDDLEENMEELLLNDSPQRTSITSAEKELLLNDSPQRTSITSAEKDLLLRLVERHRDSLFASKSCEKREAWWKLTQAFNARPWVTHMDTEQLQQCWMNLECPDHIPIVQTQNNLMMTSSPANTPVSTVSTGTAMSSSSSGLLSASTCPELPESSPMSSSLLATASQSNTPILSMDNMPVLEMDVGKQITTIQGTTLSLEDRDLRKPALTSQRNQKSGLFDYPWKSSTKTALASYLPSTSSGVGYVVPAIRIFPPDTYIPPVSPFSTLMIEGVSYPVFDSTRLYPPIDSLESGAILLPPPPAPRKRDWTGRHLPVVEESPSSPLSSSSSCSSSPSPSFPTSAL